MSTTRHVSHKMFRYKICLLKGMSATRCVSYKMLRYKMCQLNDMSATWCVSYQMCHLQDVSASRWVSDKKCQLQEKQQNPGFRCSDWYLNKTCSDLFSSPVNIISAQSQLIFKCKISLSNIECEIFKRANFRQVVKVQNKNKLYQQVR